MKAITIRLEESTIESLDDEAAEHGRTRSEHVREVVRARNEHDRIRDEYEAKLSEYQERIEDLERENERFRREKRLILEQREESTTDWETTKPKQTPDSGPEIPDPSHWHETSRLSDGTSIGRLGAYWYILDADGCAMSDGYHEISCDENGGYTGTRSARTEPVVLYTTPE